ncbi:MAG: hypothetical protein MUP26_02510 [Desulfobulbaceae bacterium]|nr:hypothetical protein [Desulfobulbaceae bacterium]
MTLCPVAIAVGCKKCPIFSVCPLKTIIGDYKKKEEPKTKSSKAGKPVSKNSKAGKAAAKSSKTKKVAAKTKSKK